MSHTTNHVIKKMNEEKELKAIKQEIRYSWRDWAYGTIDEYLGYPYRVHLSNFKMKKDVIKYDVLFKSKKSEILFKGEETKR